MKAILVIDEPESCYKCPMMFDDGNGLWCGAERDSKGEMHMRVHYYCGERERPSWCPLKQIPECPDVPDTISNDVAYILGWNDCIQEIEYGTGIK